MIYYFFSGKTATVDGKWKSFYGTREATEKENPKEVLEKVCKKQREDLGIDEIEITSFNKI